MTSPTTSADALRNLLETGPVSFVAGKRYVTVPADELRAAISAREDGGRLECGHHASMMLKSAETGLPLYCELCDALTCARDNASDAESWRNRFAGAEAEIQIGAALFEAAERLVSVVEPSGALLWRDATQGIFLKNVSDWRRFYEAVRRVRQVIGPAASAERGEGNV